MKENFKSGSMRGGWRDRYSTAWRSEHRRETAGQRAPAYRGQAEPAAYSTCGGYPHTHPGATTTGAARRFSGYTDSQTKQPRVD